MTDLKAVQCLTVKDLARLRESRWSAYQRSDVDLILDTLDVAVAALRASWLSTKRLMLGNARGRVLDMDKTAEMWCESHNLTLPQAEALGIFGEGT